MVVVQPEERNMYDQHWLFAALKERYPFHVENRLTCVEDWYSFWDIIMDIIHMQKFFNESVM